MAKAADEFGKEAFDNGLRSLAAVSKGAQAIAVETGEYFKKTFQDSAAAWQDVIGAESLNSAVEIQSRFAKSAYEGYVAETTRLTGLYTDLAKEIVKPFEDAFAKMK